MVKIIDTTPRLINIKPELEPLSFPGHMNRKLLGMPQGQFAREAWVLTRTVWRILLMEKKLDKETKNEI
jgi:hypothetical protein